MKEFATHTTLTKIVSVVLIATGFLGLVMVGTTYLPDMDILFEFGQVSNWFDLISTTSLALLGLVSGIAMWRKKQWALVTASICFAIQLIVVELPSFIWAPTSGISVYQSFSLGYDSVGNFGCGINFFALGMLFLTLLAYRQVRAIEEQQPVLET